MPRDCSETSKPPMIEMANKSERHTPLLDSPGKQLELIIVFPIDRIVRCTAPRPLSGGFSRDGRLFMLPLISTYAVCVQI